MDGTGIPDNDTRFISFRTFIYLFFAWFWRQIKLPWPFTKQACHVQDFLFYYYYIIIFKALEQKYLPNSFNNISNKPCWQETKSGLCLHPRGVPESRWAEMFSEFSCTSRGTSNILWCTEWRWLSIIITCCCIRGALFTSVQSWQLFTKLTTCERITQQAGNKEDGVQQYIMHCLYCAGGPVWTIEWSHSI